MVVQDDNTRDRHKDDGHLPDGAAPLGEHALRVLAEIHSRNVTIAVAESCTGGLLASLLTDQDGYGHCFDRGFVTYTDQAKTDLLGIEKIAIERHGVVSAQIAKAMAQGALDHSEADIGVGITGFAGPAGPRMKLALCISQQPCVMDGRLRANAISVSAAVRTFASLP